MSTTANPTSTSEPKVRQTGILIGDEFRSSVSGKTFETINPAVPIWAGTRPYEILPFQWSCHIEDGPGQMRHEEFLDLSGDAPMRAVAESMIEKLGTEGPVLMYTSYERTVTQRLVDRFPDLAPQLNAILARVGGARSTNRSMSAG